MKKLTPELARHIASGVTTLCHCWKVTPQTQSAQGFTDHDRDIAFDGLTYKASSGFTASAMESALGLKADNLEVEGALSSAALDSSKIAAGVYDYAAVEIWRVNWMRPLERVLLRKGNLGEIRRTQNGFTAELRGLAHRLNAPTGRLYQNLCDADLGDVRCRVSLQDARFKREATVESPQSTGSFQSRALASFAKDFFTGGKVQFLSGDNLGFSSEVRHHIKHAAHAEIILWQGAPSLLKAGDRFSITAGCDKRFATCRSKFNNGINFQGFPHMPGNDFAQSYARPQSSEQS